MFTRNEGWADRVIRVVAGLALFAIGFFVLQGVLTIVLGIVGAILVITGVIGVCPIYMGLKLNTRRSE